MATNFKLLKRVPQSQKCLITGYLREYESILLSDNDNNPYYNIPQLSILLTLSYYAVIEYFEFVPDII